MKNRLIIFVIFLLFVSNGISQPVILLDSEEVNRVGRSVEFLEDSTEKLSIYDVIKKDNNFKSYSQEIFLHNPSTSIYWIKFRVKNITDLKYYFQISNPGITELEIYTIEDGKPKLLKVSGSIVPFTTRDIKVNDFIFPILLPKNEIKTFYIKYFSIAYAEVPISFGTAKTIIEKKSITNLLFGMLYGLILITILFNLFQYLSTKDKTYLYYVGFVLFLGIFRFLSHGHAIQYIYPIKPWLNIKLILVAVFLDSIFLLLFAVSFLNAKERAYGLYKISYLFHASFLISFILTFYNLFLGIRIINLSLLLLVPYLLVMGIYIYLGGFKSARFYLLASSFYLFSIAIEVARQYLLVPYSYFTENILNIGFIIEAILYTFAIADRYIIVEKEKEELQNALSKELKKKADERLVLKEKLNKLNKELRDANIDVDKFLSIISKDLNNNMLKIDQVLNTLESENSNEFLESNLNEMELLIEKFTSSIHTLEKIPNPFDTKPTSL